MHSFEFQEHTEWFLPKTQNLKKKRPQYLKRFLENGNFVSLTHAEGRGATQQSFTQGSAAPRSNPLPFYIPFSTGKEPLSYAFHLQKLSTPFTCPV